MRDDTRTELVRLLELAETRLSKMPNYTWETRPEYHKALQELQYDLEQEGARFGNANGSDIIALGGTRSSSTMDVGGAIRNWCFAVRRRLGLEGGK